MLTILVTAVLGSTRTVRPFWTVATPSQIWGDEDRNVFITHSLLDMPAPQNETLEPLKCNDYITCCFVGFWWLALIKVVNKEEKDLTCKFLHPHGLSGQFHWPRGDDRGYVPSNRVIMKIQTPTMSENRRTYFITEEEKNKTQNYFETTSVYKYFLFLIDFWHI